MTGPYGNTTPDPYAPGAQQPYSTPGGQPQPYPAAGAWPGYPHQGYNAPGYGPQIPTPTGLGFVGSVKEVFSKYATFTGRAARDEYWFFLLFNVLVGVAFGILDSIAAASDSGGAVGLFVALMIIYCLAVIVPGLAVAVRRLHDTDKSGAYILFGLIPFVGGIIALVFMLLDSTPGPNQYGLAPTRR